MRQLQSQDGRRQEVALELDADPGLSLGDIVRMLGAHKWFILTCTLVCVAASAIYVLHEAPVYKAIATIRIDPGRAGSLGLGDLVTAPTGDTSDVIPTEIAIIKSDAVAMRTLSALTSDEFRAYTGLGRDQLFIPQDIEVLTERQEGVINHFKTQIGVKQEEGTQLVDISFDDKNPKIAAAIANHIVAAYTLQNFSSRDQSLAQLRTWLSAQMATLRDQVQASQEKLAAFQEANNIIGTAEASNTTTDRLKLLNDALTASQSARIAKEAQMRAAMTGDPAALASLFPNPKLQSLQAEQGTLYAQYAQLSTKFGARYSPLVEIKKQMQSIDAEIAAEVRSVQQQLRQEYTAALNNQNMLQGEYDKQEKLAYAFNRNQADYAVLQAQVTSSRELYDTLQRKLQQAGVDAQINGVNTTLVDSARAPLRPIAPKKSLTVLSGLVLGLFAGIAASFIFEATSDQLQSAAQIEKVMGFRILAAIPRLTAEPAGVKTLGRRERLEIVPSFVTLSSPWSSNAEAYRTLRNALVSFRSHPQKTLLFTSALPEEGLAKVTANLAISLAQAGSRVLLVDADLRKPSLHHVFGLENDSGLSSYLLRQTGEAVLGQPLKSERNLCLMVAGPTPALPAELLGSRNFRDQVEKWTQTFDYVILKVAPLLIVSDAIPLLEWADATVLVLNYDSARLKDLTRLRKLLTHTNAQVAGLLIDDVPIAAGVYGNYEEYAKDYYA